MFTTSAKLPSPLEEQINLGILCSTKPARIIVCSQQGIEEHSVGELDQSIKVWLDIFNSHQRIVVLGIPSSDRSFELIAIFHALIQLRIPFHFIPNTLELSRIPDHISHLVKCSSSGGNEVQQTNDVSEAEDKLQASGVTEFGGLAYCIQTSGTTGASKSVAVPWNCILPNISDFVRELQISAEDVVLFSTSLLFDPSVVEVFLSVFTGATLVVVPDFFRSNPKQLVNCIRRTRPTIVQLTPAILSLLDEGSLRWLLGAETPLRVMLVGGNKFPLDLFRRCRHPSNTTRIIDVYGITEVSCWATRFEIAHDCSEVFVGDVIDGTTLHLSQAGELFLGGSRQCSINFEPISASNLTGTGDIVESIDCGRLRIIGRVDDQVKINGIRCNLSAMSSELTTKILDVRSAQFVHFQKQFLVLFVVADSSLTEADLDCVVHPMLKPSKIVYLDNMPVNNNGKVDTPALKQQLLKEVVYNCKELQCFLKLHHMDICAPGVLEKSFVNFGFDSLLAAELSLLLGSADAMVDILSEHISIGEILKKYRITPSQLKEDIDSRQDDLSEDKSTTVRFVDHRMPDVAWAYNTHKCIDGNSVLFSGTNNDLYVFVASHSGRVAIIELKTGIVKAEKNYPTRFEASPVYHDGLIVLGGYNGILYTWCQDGLKLLSKADLGDQIKAAAVVEECSNDQSGIKRVYAFVVVYNKFLYKVNTIDGSFSSTTIASGSPAEVVHHQGNVICTTIKGTVECFEKDSLVRIWLLDLQRPIFTSICLQLSATEAQLGYLGDVHGNLYRIQLAEGVKEASLCLNEPLFARCEVVGENLLVVSQKGSLFVVSITSFRVIRKLVFPGCSFVRSPLVRPEGVYIMSTDGWLCLLSNSESSLVYRFRVCPIGNNAFSMAQFVDSEDSRFSNQILAPLDFSESRSSVRIPSLVVGSRDNWLRAFCDFSTSRYV